MERLRSADIDTLVDVVHDIGELSDLEGFRSELLGHMRRLVRCDIAAYNEVGPTPDRVEAVVDPPDCYTGDMRDSFAAHVHENPMVAYHARDPGAPAAWLSDFISGRELRRLELYDLVYGPLGTDHQIAITAPGADRVIGITASRGGQEFDQRELRLLDAVRPFLAAALHNLEARRRIDSTLAALSHARSEPAAILFVLDGGAIEPWNERAARWLGSRDGDTGALARELADWAQSAARATDGLGRSTDHAWRWIAHPSGRHRVRYVPGTSTRPAAIVVELGPRGAAVAELQTIGLTRRQAEVLQHVRHGHTNGEVARQMGVSERTVAHHLEHIYGRLGVRTRTAAVGRAQERLAGSVSDEGPNPRRP